MDIWNRSTDVREERDGETRWKQWRDEPKNISAWHIDTDNSVVMARGKKGWGLGGSEQRRGLGTSIIVSTITIKLKKKTY